MESKILLKFVTHNYCIYGKYNYNKQQLFSFTRNFLSIQGIEPYGIFNTSCQKL